MDPKFERQGIGQKLITEACRYADDSNTYMYADATPLSHSLGQKHGFKSLADPTPVGKYDTKCYHMVRYPQPKGSRASESLRKLSESSSGHGHLSAEESLQRLTLRSSSRHHSGRHPSGRHSSRHSSEHREGSSCHSSHRHRPSRHHSRHASPSSHKSGQHSSHGHRSDEHGRGHRSHGHGHGYSSHH